MKYFQILLFTFLALTGPAYADIELARKGTPYADIVVSSNMLTIIKWAALDLQEHIEKMSGARLDIVTSPGENVKNHIYLGESEHTQKLGFKLGEFKNSGFKIVAKDNHVILAGVDIQRPQTRFASRGQGLTNWQEFCGEKFSYGYGGEGKGSFNEPLQFFTNDDPGTWYSVSELLEQLGVRFYAPYDNGTVIPEKKTIAVAEQDLRKEAAYARREFCFYNVMREDGEGIKWFKRIKLGNNNIIVYNHTTYDIYSSPEQQKLHPEYLACDAKGKPYSGYPAGKGMPRYTNPGFRQAAATYMNKMFEAIPGLSAISIGSPDGGVRMDARDENLYGNPTNSLTQKASQYVWDFHMFLCKELKKSHPDKYLLYFTGYGANEIPENIVEFPDNLLLTYGNSGASMVLEEVSRERLDFRKRWQAKMKTIKKGPMWDYFLQYRTSDNPRYPVFYTAELQKEMQEMLPYCDGKFIEIQPVEHRVEGEKNPYYIKYPRWRLGNHGLIHLMVYWQSKLFWDPYADRKAMLEEYYKLFFGPAAKEMKEFHEFAEEVWMRQESRSVTATSGFLKEEDVNRYFDILKRAHGKAGRDTVYDRRIAQMEIEMESLKKLFPNLKRSGPELRAHTTEQPVIIDGDLQKPLWSKLPSWSTMGDLVTGEIPDKNRTLVSFRWPYSRTELVLAVICKESRMDKIVARAKNNDDPEILKDDAIEIYIATPERSYFRIVVNPDGKIWDESQDVTIVARDTLPNLWNPGIKAVARKEKDCWTVELSIPTKDLGSLGPAKPYAWGVNVCRRRLSGGEPEEYALSPTGTNNFLELPKLGNLWVRY